MDLLVLAVDSNYKSLEPRKASSKREAWNIVKSLRSVAADIVVMEGTQELYNETYNIPSGRWIDVSNGKWMT